MTANTGTQSRVVHRKGIADTDTRDYGIINKVRSIDQTNDKYLKRSRSSSRMSRDVNETIPIVRKDSLNWKQRGTQASIGGVLGVVKARSSSKKPTDRSRSRARKEGSGDDRDDGEKKGFFRGRSSSRQRSDSRGPAYSIRRSISRGLSKVRGGKNETRRGRSTDRRGDESNIKNTSGGQLPPKPPGQNKPPRNNTNNLPPKPPTENTPETEITDDVIDNLIAECQLVNEAQREKAEREEAERQLIAEVMDQTEVQEEQMNEEKRSGTDSLNDNVVMQLDKGNTIMHVACLLHRSSSNILEHLEDKPDLAKSSNNANETPLHYAAMDKQGVSKEVLKQLIRLNPEAVKQPNVQNSLPIHLACMVGAPSTYVIKTFLKMYPKATMIQSDFPLLFEDDMEVRNNDNGDDDSSTGEFVSYRPKEVTAVSGIASMFACAAPNQAAIDMSTERSKRKVERHRESIYNEEGPEVERGFSPLHLAVMNSAKSSVIYLLVKVNPRCVHLKTSRGRTALDCAQYIVRQHWLYGTDDEVAIQNTFGAIEILEAAVEQDES